MNYTEQEQKAINAIKNIYDRELQKVDFNKRVKLFEMLENDILKIEDDTEREIAKEALYNCKYAKKILMLRAVDNAVNEILKKNK